MRILTPALCLALAGCSHVSPLGLARVSRLSPLEADPADISVILALPHGLGVVPATAKLTMSFLPAPDAHPETTQVILVQQSGALGERFRIAPEDQDRLRDVQLRARLAKETHGRAVGGNLNVSLAGCRKGAVADLNDTVSILVQTAPDSPPFALVSDAPLSRVFGAGDVATMPPCPVSAS